MIVIDFKSWRFQNLRPLRSLTLLEVNAFEIIGHNVFKSLTADLTF
jgi:hypothetical protein